MRVLYVEDNPADIDLAVRHFKKHAPNIIMDTARSQAEALRKIMRPDFSNYDLVLTDMHLQDGDGIAILTHMRGNSIPVAVVILTGQGDEKAAVAALKAGADDYVTKKGGFLDKLPGILEEALQSYQNTLNREINNLRVLYVEHNQADVDFTKRHFAKFAHHIRIDAINSVATFYEMVGQTNFLNNYDVLLLDYRLPQENALEILKKIRRSTHSDIPVILITGKGDEEIAVKSLKLGAFDYLTKDQGYLFKLPSVIENAYYHLRLEREHQALLESEQRYRALFENNHVAMLLVDPENGKIVDANLSAVSFYGWSREELTQKSVFDINTLNPQDLQKEISAASQEKKSHFIFKHRRSNDVETDVEVYSAPIEVGGRKLLYSLIYDISDRLKTEKEKRKLQKQLTQAYKMEAVGQLASGIAHDFNNILSSVLGFAELSLDTVPTGTELEDYLQEIFSAGKRAKNLVKQILAFARQSDEEKAPISPGEVIKEVLKFIRATIPTTIEIRQDLDSEACILGNATQVHQVMMNLCTNAAFAMEESGGILAVSLKDVGLEKEDLSSGMRQGDYVEIKVSDTGAGIAPEIMDSIFEPYFTTKELGKGTGMGLAMVQGVIDSYSGKISVESQLGKGTTFTIYLPITKERSDQDAYVPEQLSTGIERVLFVDDEVSIVKMGSQILKRLGYSVTTRTSSIEALELFQAKPNDFDLVISDMTMPNLTGDKLAIELMKIRQDIPVILCTGYSKKISDEIASEIGIKAFAYKPVVKADLAKTVRKVLDEAKS
jgi:PAS domain S-box-containing protein